MAPGLPRAAPREGRGVREQGARAPAVCHGILAPPPPAASATGQGFGCSGTGVGVRCPWGTNHGQAMLGQLGTDASSARGGGPRVKGRPVSTGTPQPCKGCSSTAGPQTVHVRNLCKVVTNNPIPLKQPRDTAGSGMPLGEASPWTADPWLASRMVRCTSVPSGATPWTEESRWACTSRAVFSARSHCRVAQPRDVPAGQGCHGELGWGLEEGGAPCPQALRPQ